MALLDGLAVVVLGAILFQLIRYAVSKKGEKGRLREENAKLRKENDELRRQLIFATRFKRNAEDD